jgi:hypothetical protein
MFWCSINYLDNVLNNQTLIIKRSSIYLYKTIFFFILLILSIISINYLFKGLSNLFIIFIYIYEFFIFGWIILAINYLVIYNKKSKVYYLISDKIKLIKDRQNFILFFYYSLFLLWFTLIFIFIFISVFFLTISWLYFWNGVKGFLFYLFLIIFFLIICIYLEYLIIKRFYNLEVDLIIFSESGIKKEVHNSFFNVFPYFLDVKEIWDINISFNWILCNLFDVWSINISSRREVRHYNYLKDPSKVYEVILKLIKNR